MTDEEKLKLAHSIFNCYDYIPPKVQMHYIETWNKLLKISFETYFEMVLIDNETKWWHNAEMIKRSYVEYIQGRLNSKQPTMLPFYPHQVLEKIIKEVDDMIHFKNYKS